MDQSRHPGSTTALHGGRLEGINLPDLLWALCQQKKTGVLQLSRAVLRKSVYIEEGRIVFASSNDPDERLGELFLRQGNVSLLQLENALSQLHTGKRLGTLLVESQSLSPDDLVQGVLAQVESIVLDLFTWEDGEYRFKEGPLPTDEVITLGMKTGELLLRGIRKIHSFHRIRRSVGPAHLSYGLAPDWSDTLEGIALTEGEQLLVERLRDADEGVEQLCREVFLSNFEIYQTLWGLKILGTIEEREIRAAAAGEATREGSLREVGLDELLVQLGRERESGVLYMGREDQERTFHITDGRCVFATSSDVEDSLVAYLLRRGVISLRDRDETEKRLLTNKRVGTILWELGVIDDRDLREMVRQQISEIVFDTFRWEDAHFVFVAGPLPSNEQIMLEESLDRLVAEGIRRVTSWGRVKRGCGGLDAALALHPTYMEVLDAMGAGPEEWHVMAALKSVRTPREICRESDLGDFRVCQILWAMRVLGAVEIRPRSELVEQPAQTAAEPSEPGEPREIVVTDLDKPAAEEGLDEEPEYAAEADPDEDEAELVAADAAEPADAVAEQSEASAEQTRAEEERQEEDELPEKAVTPTAEAEEPEPELVSDEVRATAQDDVVEDAVEEPATADEPEGEPIEVLHASSEAEPAVEYEPEMNDDRPLEFPAGATQVIPRDVVEDALAAAPEADAGESEISWDEAAKAFPNATRVIQREEVEAALAQPPDASMSDQAALDEHDEPEQEDGWHEATQIIPRGVVESFLASETIEGPEADEFDFEPPHDLDSVISRFNAMQRLVYRTIRSEVGAGAVNFIRACCGHLAPTVSDSLQGAALNADGSWDSEGLRRAVVKNRVEDPWPGYQRLIEIEIELLREHIGEARVLELQRQVAKVEGAGVAEA